MVLMVRDARKSTLLTMRGRGGDPEQSVQISFRPFKLACPFLPTMMWSCTAIPSGFATSITDRVICTSACDGVGSPLG